MFFPIQPPPPPEQLIDCMYSKMVPTHPTKTSPHTASAMEKQKRVLEGGDEKNNKNNAWSLWPK